MKKSIVAISVLVVALMSLASVTFAASVVKSPAEIVSGLTGKTIEEVTAARQEGNTYGAQAIEAGQLEAFQQERLAQFKAALDEAVANGTMTQEQADERYANMQLRLESCDGTGIGAGNGMKAGGGRGGRDGRGGMRNGTGMGGGLRNGTGSGFVDADGDGVCDATGTGTGRGGLGMGRTNR